MISRERHCFSNVIKLCPILSMLYLPCHHYSSCIQPDIIWLGLTSNQTILRSMRRIMMKNDIFKLGCSPSRVSMVQCLLTETVQQKKSRGLCSVKCWIGTHHKIKHYICYSDLNRDLISIEIDSIAIPDVLQTPQACNFEQISRDGHKLNHEAKFIMNFSLCDTWTEAHDGSTITKFHENLKQFVVDRAESG